MKPFLKWAGGNAMSQDTHRGHPIREVNGVWYYPDDTPVASDPFRQCGYCNLPNRSDGHDACLGYIPGAMNACCGHGNPKAAYVQREAVTQ